MKHDLVIAGAGTGGLTAAIFAARSGARVLVVEASGRVGGSLNIASGQLSAAGTRLQCQEGITDTPTGHFLDVMRISHGNADPSLVRLAVENAGATVDWLMDQGVEFLDGHPVLGLAHEPYSARRYYWGREFGMTVLRGLLKPFEQLVESGLVTLLLDTKLVGLDRDDAGRVVGVMLEDFEGRAWAEAAPELLLATGGYNANPELFLELSGVPAWGGDSYPTNRGEGLQLARQVGAQLRGSGMYLPGFGRIPQHDGLGAPLLSRHIHHPELRKPWEVYVNTDGERFMAEDEPSVDTREHALLAQPLMRRFVIMDEIILSESPPLVQDRANPELKRDWFGQHPMFQKSSTLEGLADRIGVDAGNLERTINEYNRFGTPDRFGRQYRPRPIIEPPFYSILVQGASVTSTVGLSVSQDLEVLDESGTAIPGLFAVGEILGSATFMGDSFCGGMMATPAMTFGRLYGVAAAARRLSPTPK